MSRKSASDVDALNTLDALDLKVADVVGGLMELWGFRRALGRVWTVLYLSPEPLSAATLATRLHMSAGAVSMAAAELQKWGVIQRAWRPGDRRDYFEAETRIWKMVCRVLRERELQAVRSAAESFREAQTLLQRARSESTAETLPGLRFKGDRLSMLLGLSRVGEILLKAVVGGQPVDPSRIATLFEDRSPSSPSPSAKHPARVGRRAGR